MIVDEHPNKTSLFISGMFTRGTGPHPTATRALRMDSFLIDSASHRCHAADLTPTKDISSILKVVGFILKDDVKCSYRWL